MPALRILLAVAVLIGLTVACSGGNDETTAGIRVVSAETGGQILDNPPDGLVVLDVRTPEEFAAGHLPGAIMIDFNGPDFRQQIAELDPEVPYLLYCRSGNRSSGARAVMEDLGFVDVADVDGGILAWSEAGLPVTTS
jgi:rhodanese-related sulfurtransferase